MTVYVTAGTDGQGAADACEAARTRPETNSASTGPGDGTQRLLGEKSLGALDVGACDHRSGGCLLPRLWAQPAQAGSCTEIPADVCGNGDRIRTPASGGETPPAEAHHQGPDRFREAAQEFLREYANGRHPGLVRRAKHVIANWYRFTRRVCPEFLCERFADPELTRRTVGDWLASLAARQATSTLRMHRRLIITFLRWAARNGKVPQPPPRLPPAPRGQQRVRPIVTVAEYDAVKRHTTGTIWYWAVVALWNTGGDLADVSLLVWDNVDWDRMLVAFQRHKTRRLAQAGYCFVPIVAGTDFHQALMELYEMRKTRWPKSQFVCPPLAHRWLMSPAALSAKFSSVLRSAGLAKRVGPKAFRRAFISRLANAGTHLAVAMAMTGHVSARTFGRYVMPDLASLHNAARKALEWCHNLSPGTLQPQPAVKRLSFTDAVRWMPEQAIRIDD